MENHQNNEYEYDHTDFVDDHHESEFWDLSPSPQKVTLKLTSSSKKQKLRNMLRSDKFLSTIRLER